MTVKPTRWSLGAKLALVGAPFLLLALLSTCATLWISWKLDGGAAAVNEAGRMRMEAYRMALVVSNAGHGGAQELSAQARAFEDSLDLLRKGDPQRPLQVPWDSGVRERFVAVEGDWNRFRANWLIRPRTDLDRLNPETVDFVADIDTLVNSIEVHMSGWTASLHLLQVCLLMLALVGSGILLVTGYLFVLEPVGLLKYAIQKIQGGDFGYRVEHVGNDEFGALAEGFNGMAEHLQSMYGNLESKVTEKTAELEEKRERLESLYEVTALVSRATSLEELAQEFARRIKAIAQADAVALRWLDPSERRYLMLAAVGLPKDMVDDEQCLTAGDCFCGMPALPPSDLVVIPIKTVPEPALKHCTRAGYETIVNVPVRVQDRLMGEVNLFYRTKVSPTPAERSLLEALGSHLASAMENLRLNALERAAAVSGERHHLSRELHDSIAQSLAFLKIQVQLMRDALRSQDPALTQKVLEEIDIGVRECYGDVRELLVHFRTKTNAEDIEPALATTLRKFELQTGLRTTLESIGHGLPLSAEVQIQVLHIMQEALSNVRKYAQASHVWLRVVQQPVWEFEVRDDGVGFAMGGDSHDETHVGLHIMSERAQRIGATLRVQAAPGRGCSVHLRLAGTGAATALEPQPAILQSSFNTLSTTAEP